MDILKNGISNGKCFDVRYTDFAKAFDKVPHKRLLAKLSSYGIKKSLLEWINSFLTHWQETKSHFW
jgi:ribonuclease P/MRP protein subunit RPP40